MYQSAPCSCRKKNTGLGDSSSIVPLLATAAGTYAGGPAVGAAAGAAAAGADSGGASGAGGASGGASMPVGVTVSPGISTQISPQISPVFQQQFQPTNSAAIAGTSQVLPAMPGVSGSDNGILPPGYASPYGPTGPMVPQIPATPIDYMRIMPYALGGLALIAVVKIFSKRKAA